MRRVLLVGAVVVVSSCWDFKKLASDCAEAGRCGDGGNSSTGGGSTDGGASQGGGSSGGGSAGGGGSACAVPAGGDWCWENPWPLGSKLTTVWSNGPDDTWIGGTGGVVLHIGPADQVTVHQQFQAITDQQRQPIQAIASSGTRMLVLSGSSTGHAWLVTDAGVTQPTINFEPRMLAKGPNGDLVIAGQGQSMCRLSPTGSQFQDISPPAFSGIRTAIGFDAFGTCLTVSYDYLQGTVSNFVSTCDGGMSAQLPVSGAEVRSFWSAGSINYFGTNAPQILAQAADEVFSGGVLADAGVEHDAVAGIYFPDAGSFAVGTGTYVVSNGGPFALPRDWGLGPDPGDLVAIHGSSPDNVWAVGAAGKIWQGDGTVARLLTRGHAGNIDQLFVSDDVALAIGFPSQLLGRDGGTWVVDQSAPPTCHNVWCAQDTCICSANGPNAASMRATRSNTSWVQATWDDMRLAGVWFDHLSEVWFLDQDVSTGSSTGAIRVVDLSNGFPSTKPASTDVPCANGTNAWKAIHGSGGVAWVVGDYGCVAEVFSDGGSVEHSLANNLRLYDVWAVGPSHVFAISEDRLHEFTDGGWVTTQLPGFPSPGSSGVGSGHSVWVSGNQVWVAGPNIVEHLVGANWIREDLQIGPDPSGYPFEVRSVRGNSTQIFIGGEGGSILSKHR